MTDQDDSEEKRTEGVRIIGAQEAAEVAGRPDVVRRRRRSEKKFGDRPDEPEPVSDLPKIKISTTETSDDPAVALGAVPMVRSSAQGEPTHGADDESEQTRAGLPKVGHARILGPGESEEKSLQDESEEGGPGGAPSGSGGESSFTQEETEAWDESPLFSSESSGDDQDDWTVEDPFEHDDALGDAGEEESFVLPHWTEPATGQVPKVVSGVEPEEDTSFTELPRWQIEGERVGAADFADLVEDGPRLGALGDRFDEDDDDFFDDDFFDEDRKIDEPGGFSDFFEQEESMFEDPAEPRSRRPRSSRAPSSDQAGSGGEGRAGGDRDLVTAVLVGLGLVGVGLVCFWLGGLATTVLVAVILLVAAGELINALKVKGFSTPGILAVPAILGLLLGTYFSGVEAYPVVLGLTVVTAMLWYLWVSPGHRAAQKLGGTLLVVMWIGFLGSFATLMLGIGRQMQELDTSLKSNPGIGVLIAAVLVTVSHDVGAYFTGRQLGRTPLSSASPNKTYEGLAGGVIAGILVPTVVVGIFHLHPIGESIAKTIIFSALCSMVAPLGDLCESAIKRDLEVKDMGTVLPGHGGVLDRFDAMLFVLPTAYFVTLLMGTWTVTPG